MFLLSRCERRGHRWRVLGFEPATLWFKAMVFLRCTRCHEGMTAEILSTGGVSDPHPREGSSMGVISVPPPKPWEPKPPSFWQTIGLPTGTVAENDGTVWLLRKDGDEHGSWRWWEPQTPAPEARTSTEGENT